MTVPRDDHDESRGPAPDASASSSPSPVPEGSTPSPSPFEDQVVLYVDGGLGPDEQQRFELALQGSSAAAASLRERVRRAHAVRRLVASLPRVRTTDLPSLASFSIVLERVDVEESEHVATLLRGLRRHAPPAAIGAAFRAQVGQEAQRAGEVAAARATAAAPVEMLSSDSSPRPVLRLAWRRSVSSWAAAAALLTVAGLLAFSAPAPHPSGSRIPGVSFRFEVVRGEPGRPVDPGAERGLHHLPPGSARPLGGGK